jgi:hypothetical protein
MPGAGSSIAAIPYSNMQIALKQLEQDYAQLQQDPGDVGTARSFFVTAAHLPEWIKDRAYKKSLQQQELIVEICDELANGGKHGKSDKKKPVVLHTEYDAYVERDYVEPGYYEETLQVTLTLEAAQELGMENQVTDVLTLATLTLEFWKAHPAFKSR